MKKILTLLLIAGISQTVVAETKCYCQSFFKKQECYDLGGGIKDCMPPRWRWYGVIEESNGQSYVATSEVNSEDSCWDILLRSHEGCQRPGSNQ